MQGSLGWLLALDAAQFSVHSSLLVLCASMRLIHQSNQIDQFSLRSPLISEKNGTEEALCRFFLLLCSL